MEIVDFAMPASRIQAFVCFCFWDCQGQSLGSNSPISSSQSNRLGIVEGRERSMKPVQSHQEEEQVRRQVTDTPGMTLGSNRGQAVCYS